MTLTPPNRSPRTKDPLTPSELNLTEAQQALDDAQLSSPVSGTVASVGVSVGATVSAGGWKHQCDRHHRDPVL